MVYLDLCITSSNKYSKHLKESHMHKMDNRLMQIYGTMNSQRHKEKTLGTQKEAGRHTVQTVIVIPRYIRLTSMLQP